MKRRRRRRRRITHLELGRVIDGRVFILKVKGNGWMPVVPVIGLVFVVKSDGHLCENLKCLWVLSSQNVSSLKAVHKQRIPSSDAVLQRVKELDPRRSLKVARYFNNNKIKIDWYYY
jgi:hypothetical protein